MAASQLELNRFLIKIELLAAIKMCTWGKIFKADQLLAGGQDWQLISKGVSKTSSVNPVSKIELV